MKTPENPSAVSTAARVQDLDDATLRNGHALLDADRAHGFAMWLGAQLDSLEERFREFATPSSVRRSLGR